MTSTKKLTTELHGNRITAPRQGALTDKCDTLPRTIKATVYINAGWIYPTERAAEERKVFVRKLRVLRGNIFWEKITSE